MTRPIIYEINTATFLTELGVTLADVPDAVWDDIAAKHFNTVWLMGVWQRSNISIKMNQGQAWLKEALPDVTDNDVLGSAYSIASYTVDQRFGGNDGLAIARGKLKERGISLWLDYVPNHVAIDNEWTVSHPEYFLPGTARELQHHPGWFQKVGEYIYANGKDPNYDPWSDVLQLNAFSPELRAQTIETLKTLATMCDGVRCDMAMLMMNDIFAKTWGKRAGAEPRDDFWPSIIRTVKTANPDFLFTAEVYWDREAALLNQGFDFCYDKELYDALIEGSGRHVNARLHQHSAIQQQLLRFIENHDEPRAARMEWRQHQAAAVILASLPGARLYHDGQFDGRIHRVPVQLTRRQAEQKSSSVEAFYTNLLGFDFRGQWRPLAIHKGLFGGASVLSWEWDNYAVIVNFGSRKVNVVLPLSTDGLKLGSIEKKGEHVILQPYGYAIIEK